MQTYYFDSSSSVNHYVFEPCVIALGFFDGVHLGHRKIIDTAKQIAEEKRLKLAVMTFFPHPSQVIPTAKKVDVYLSPLSVKKEIFAELGVESLYIVNFDELFSKISHEAFVHSYLKNLNCKHVVAGFDFTYGYKGKGTMKQLKKDGIGLFDITTVAKVHYRNEKISSTIIRHLLRSGKVDEIHHYLGDNYCVLGKIIDVQSRENTSDVFQMEISDDYLLPKSGIYDVQLSVMEKVFDGMIYLPETTANIFEVIVTGLNRIGDNATAKIKFINRRFDDDKQGFFNEKQLERAI